MDNYSSVRREIKYIRIWIDISKKKKVFKKKRQIYEKLHLKKDKLIIFFY